MSLAVEAIFVWFPMMCSALFVGHYARRRLREGLSVLGVLTDRNFLIVFLYTGALLAIYLSCFYFFYLAPRPPAPVPEERRIGRMAILRSEIVLWPTGRGDRNPAWTGSRRFSRSLQTQVHRSQSHVVTRAWEPNRLPAACSSRNRSWPNGMRQEYRDLLSVSTCLPRLGDLPTFAHAC